MVKERATTNYMYKIEAGLAAISHTAAHTQTLGHGAQ